MITRYFVLPESQIKGYKADLIPDNDFLPISNLKVIKYPNPIADGRYIVKAELPPYVLKSMTESCADFDVEDPLTLEGVVALGIAGSYAGVDRDDVLQRFPELQGQHKIGEDEEGGDVMVDIFPVQRFSGE